MIHCFYPNTLKLSESALKALNEYYILNKYENLDTITEEAEVLIGNPPESLPTKLKWVQMIAAGYDSVNLQQLQDKGIHLTNGSGTTSVAIAEYVLASILYSYKELGNYTNQHFNSNWNPLAGGRELSGSKIALLGTGHIGKEIASRLKAFNVTLHGFNSSGKEVENFDKVSPLNEFDYYSHDFDCVILALPLNVHTKHFFNENRLRSLKDSCTLVNVGRGAVIELDALESIIDTHLNFVVLDVVEIEPLPQNSKLWNHKKTLITPHISYMSQHRTANIEKLIVANLLSYARGEKLQNIIL